MYTWGHWASETKVTCLRPTQHWHSLSDMSHLRSSGLSTSNPYTTLAAGQGRGSSNWAGLCRKMPFIQQEKEREGNSMCQHPRARMNMECSGKPPKCLWLCLCGIINKYICMSELIILDLFMQNICKSHLNHSMHFNCPSKINKNKLNNAFFMGSNLLANPSGLPVFPNMELTVMVQ